MLGYTRNQLLIGLICIVNALGYGITIPITYTYALKYGLSTFENGLLFAVFSLCQFISTPLIGRLSDIHGRRPLLIGSIAGTAISFFMMAFAPNALFLFLARALDGFTAGNIPVAAAVIADTSKPEERAKGFGLIGASFNFGFIAGPAITGLTLAFSDKLPFIIAASIATIAAILTYVILPETNPSLGKTHDRSLFDFRGMAKALRDERIGLVLFISLIYALAFSLFIYAYQAFAVQVLNMSDRNVSFLFVLFGVIGLATTALLLSRLTKKFGIFRTYLGALLVIMVAYVAMSLSGSSIALFVASSAILGVASTIVNPLSQTILSQRAGSEQQGEIQGLNASYMSIGQIFGPILGGLIGTFSLGYPFLAGALCIAVCVFLALRLKPEQV
jgi:multidrug resistance protein